MKALIPAAGRGSRVASIADEKPKCLLEVGGAPIIERIIGAAKEAGITEFVIVTGFAPEAIPAALGDGRRLGVSIEYVHNPRWHDLANGYSIHVARERVSDPFLILMSDHVFAPSMLTGILARRPPPDGCILLTDPKVDDIFDVDDATKVQTDGQGLIVRMGKTLTAYDRIDTGIFFASLGLCRALDRAIARGETSITAANNELTAAGLMLEHPVSDPDAWWFDLDTPESIRHFERFLAARP